MLKLRNPEIANAEDIQRAYNKVYSAMRQYTWNMSVVEKLADVEARTYEAFVDCEELEKSLRQLELAVSSVLRDDEEMQKAFDDFKAVIELVGQEDHIQYANLPYLELPPDDEPEDPEIVEEPEVPGEIDIDPEELIEEPEEEIIDEDTEESEESYYE